MQILDFTELNREIVCQKNSQSDFWKQSFFVLYYKYPKLLFPDCNRNAFTFVPVIARPGSPGNPSLPGVPGSPYKDINKERKDILY